MTRLIVLLTVFLSLLAACQTPKKDQESIKITPENLKIDSLAQRYQDLGRFSGTILVAQGDSILYNSSFGKADYEAMIKFSDQTTFKIGFLTELITA